MSWVASHADDGSWHVWDAASTTHDRNGYVYGEQMNNGRQAHTVANHRNGKHRKPNQTCPECP